MSADPVNTPASPRRGMTLVEVIIVTLLTGLIVPALTSTLTRSIGEQSRNTRRELAVLLAEEGTELMLNAGYKHWMGPFPLLAGYPVRPGVTVNANYAYNVAVPNTVTQDVTLTIRAQGRAPVVVAANNDDPFNPFVGNMNIGVTPAPPQFPFRPWSWFSRRYIFYSKSVAAGEPPRVLEGTVEVFYGQGIAPAFDTADVVRIPVYLGKHVWRPPTPPLPIAQPVAPPERGILWCTLGTTIVSTINAIPISPAGRSLWGGSNTRSLFDSAYPPIAAGTYAPP